MYISNIEDKRRNWNILQGGGGTFHLRKRKRETFDFFWLKLPLTHSLPFLGKLVAPFCKITKINRKYDKTVELWVKGNLTVISEVTCRDSEPNQCKYIFISLQNTMSSLIEFKQRRFVFSVSMFTLKRIMNEYRCELSLQHLRITWHTFSAMNKSISKIFKTSLLLPSNKTYNAILQIRLYNLVVRLDKKKHLTLYYNSNPSFTE